MRVTVEGREAVHEVHTVALREIAEERAVIHEVQRIPAHVRDVEMRRDHTLDRTHLTRNQPEAFMLPILEGAVEQQLHAEADPEKRLPRRRLRLHEIEEPAVAQLLHGVTERTDPRQDHMIRLPDDLLIRRHHHLLADRSERALQREEISHAIFDDCNHSRPFNLIFPIGFSGTSFFAILHIIE